jgi:hypothetical protein
VASGAPANAANTAGNAGQPRAPEENNPQDVPLSPEAENAAGGGNQDADEGEDEAEDDDDDQGDDEDDGDDGDDEGEDDDDDGNNDGAANSGGGATPNPGAPAPAAGISFTDDVYPILVTNCGRCHASGGLPNLASANIDTAFNTAVRDSGDIVQLIAQGEMPADTCNGAPGSNGCVSVSDFNLIQQWVAAGRPR